MESTTTTNPFPTNPNTSEEELTRYLNLTDGIRHVFNVTLLPDPTAPPTPPPLPLEVVHAKILRGVYLWVLVGVGVPANTACVLTIFSMGQPPYYVAVLAVADSVTLGLKLLFHQLVTHRVLTPASCLLFYFPNFFGCFANWVLILISLERFVAVCFPFKKQQWFKKSRIVVSVLGLAGALLLVFLPTFFFYSDVQSSRKVCVVRESLLGYKKNVWDAGLMSTLYFFLPFFLVALLTAIIIRRLQVIRQRRQRSQSGGSRSGQGGPEHAVSVMLVCASLIFLLLVLPACLYHVALKHRFDPQVLKERARSYLFYQVVTVMSDTTHAVNFFVYFLSAAKFRAAFADTLRWCCPWCARCLRKGGEGYSASKSVPLTASVMRGPGKDTEHCDTVL